MKTSNTTPKKIVDKNGKPTTVHVGRKSREHDTKLREALTAIAAYQQQPHESITFDEMKDRAKDIHPNAYVYFGYNGIFIRVDDEDDGLGSIEIKTNWVEESELPDLFKGTLAEEALNTKSEGYRSSLHRWAKRNESFGPLTVAAAEYNIRHESWGLQQEWSEKKARELGVRTPKELMAALDSFKAESPGRDHLVLNDLPDIKREEFDIFMSSISDNPTGECAEYIMEKQKVWYDLIDKTLEG